MGTQKQSKYQNSYLQEQQQYRSFRLKQRQEQTQNRLIILKMGICPTLHPQMRVLQHHNQQLINFIKSQGKDLRIYNFYPFLMKSIQKVPQRYLLNEGILEDIYKLHMFSKSQVSKSQIADFCYSGHIFDEEIKNSCLILENELMSDIQSEKDNTNLPNLVPDSSFQNNISKNQSLVAQINVVYGKQISKEQYSQALKLFLKFVQYFNQHAHGGFLKPIYRALFQSLLTIDSSDIDTLVDQVSVFVQLMVKIHIHIYNLKNLNSAKNGKLFKNENIYNLVMSFMFKKTKIKPFIRGIIRTNHEARIRKFEDKLEYWHKKHINWFSIDKKFLLLKSDIKAHIKGNLQKNNMNKKNRNELEGSQQVQSLMSFKSRIQQLSYQKSLKLVSILCSPSMEHGLATSTPISKLKTLILISKTVTSQIRQFYREQLNFDDEDIPQLDPDNLQSIIMYLIANNNNYTIYEELKMIEYFTTTNTLNCISGYYLNVFMAACDLIIDSTNDS